MYLDIDAVDGNHPLNYCDLKNIVFDIIKHSNSSNTNLKLSAELVVAYDSIARGGEVNFQKFSDWDFDYRTNVLDTKWQEPKTMFQ